MRHRFQGDSFLLKETGLSPQIQTGVGMSCSGELGQLPQEDIVERETLKVKVQRNNLDAIISLNLCKIRKKLMF